MSRAKDNSHPPHASGVPSNSQEQRRLAVIMFTDMVGYSALTQRDEALALELLEAHRQIVRPILAQHGGREIKTIGDAFLVEFSSALAAVTCAIELQRSLHSHNAIVPAERQTRIRIGLHAGDIVYKENDVFGDGVNIAARIEPLAEPGGICVSEDVARQVQNKLDCPLVELGLGELKNIHLPVKIHRVVLPWSTARAGFGDRFSFSLRKKSVRRGLIAFALTAVAVAGIVFWLRQARPQFGPTTRLAVLPMINISGDAHDEYFADGMTEELISSLASIRELNVIARTSVAKFKGAKLDVSEIGLALNVGSLLEGSVRIAGEAVRVSVHLVDVRSQKTIWSREFPGQLKDIFAVQSAIAMSVSDALKVQLLSGERSRIERRGTGDSEAYRQFALGWAQLNKRTSGEVMKAVQSFSDAIARDPGFAAAHAGLAQCYTLIGSAGYGTMPRALAIELARASASKAVALDSSLAEAHVALAYVRFRIDWDWAGTESEFKRAIELQPGNAKAHELYGLFLAVQKRFEEALAHMRQAQALDPLSSNVGTGIGRVLHFDRKYEEAIAQFRKTIARDPNYAEAHFSLAMTYQVLRRYDEALAAQQTALRLSGNRPVMLAMLAVLHAGAGRTEEAKKIYQEILQSADETPSAAYFLGIISNALGDNDRAFEYFEKSYEDRDGILIYLGVDPIGERLWSDPRFKTLMRKIGLAG